MGEPAWIDEALVLEPHSRTIRLHGGLPGVRDLAALRSALDRPVNKWAYGSRDLFELAAAYGFGLARSHAFSDGNKRVAYIATRFFLLSQGVTLNAEDGDKVRTFLALAAGDVTEADLAVWLRGCAAPA